MVGHIQLENSLSSEIFLVQFWLGYPLSMTGAFRKTFLHSYMDVISNYINISQGNTNPLIFF